MLSVAYPEMYLKVFAALLHAHFVTLPVLRTCVNGKAVRPVLSCYRNCHDLTHSRAFSRGWIPWKKLPCEMPWTVTQYPLL